jgi:hypothetical protein
MASGTGLPTVNSAPVLTQAPGGVGGDALFSAQSWQQIAASGDRLAKDGADALSVVAHQSRVGHLSESDNVDRRKRIELQDQFSDNPAAFDLAWTAYKDGKLGEAEPWAVNHIRATLGTEGNAAYASLLNTKRATIQTQAKQSWTAQEDIAANDVTGAAMAGTLIPNGPNGEVLDPRVIKYHGVVTAGVTSQFIPQEEADRRAANLESTATVYAARTGIKKIFDNQGEGPSGPIGAIKEIDSLVRDEKLKLSPEQRLGLGTRLRADVHGWDAERRQSLEAVDLRAKALLEARTKGTAIPDGEISDTIDQYKRFGGQAQAASFLSDMQLAQRLSFIARSPLSESAAYLDQLKTERGFNAPPQAAKTAMEYFQSQGWTKEQAAGIVGNLVHESGLNPAAVHDSGTGLGVAGHRLERLDAMKAFATARGKPVTDFQTQLEFINQELNSNESAAGIRLRNAGTAKDAAAAFVHFERPQGYDPANIAAAHGYDNRVGQAVRLAGGVVAPATPGDIALIGRGNKIVIDRVSAEVDALVKGMEDQANPVLPTQQRINDLLTAASATNTPELLDKVAKAAAEFQYWREFGRAPLPDQTALLSELHRKAVTEGLSTTDARILQLGTEVRDRTAKALQDDPLAHTVSVRNETANLPPLVQLQLNNSPAFRAGLALRAQWAALGTKTFETAPMPALTTAEATQVRAALDAAEPAGKARIYGDIVASTSGGMRMATLAQLGGKGVDGMVEAFAGGMLPADNRIAESIIRGQSALKIKDAFNPMKDGHASNTSAALDRYLPSGAFSLPARTNPLGQFAVMRGAVLARVADLAATDPNFKGEFSDSLIQRAVNDVTGGIVTHNGAPIISPVRGQGQGGFDSRIYGLTDGDLQGAMTLSGTPITAAYVQQTAQLETLSDGRYLIRLGRRPEEPIYAFRDIGAPGAGRIKPFVLDLRKVTPKMWFGDGPNYNDPAGAANDYFR